MTGTAQQDRAARRPPDRRVSRRFDFPIVGQSKSLREVAIRRDKRALQGHTRRTVSGNRSHDGSLALLEAASEELTAHGYPTYDGPPDGRRIGVMRAERRAAWLRRHGCDAEAERPGYVVDS
jgi:hypothetical protein